MSVPVLALRYTYGKVVEVPGGAVAEGFEHQPTAQSPGIAPEELAFCHPKSLLGQVSTRLLVHESAHRQGAFFCWPVRHGGRERMILGRLRPRPEQGEDQPGRTYTQLNAVLIEGADWRARAPEIVACLPRWLRAEPDRLTDFASGAAAPPLAIVPAERPVLDVADPLPAPDDPGWRMLAALERESDPLLVGAADESAFCAALARALALLPPSLRMLISAGGGFAAIREELAIQWVPGAPERAETAPGFFALESELRGLRTVGDWERHAREDLDPALAQSDASAHWRTPAEARRRAATLIQALAQGQRLESVVRWLDGDLSQCPELPGGPAGRALRPRIVAALGERLSRGLAADRADLSLVRAAELAARLNGPEWARAWLEAIRAARESAPGAADLALWSVLRAEPGADDPAAGLGVIPSFAALARLRRLDDRLAGYYRASDTPNPRILRHAGLAARLQALLARAPGHLLRHPFDLIALAETFPDAFADGQGGAQARAALRQIAAAAGLVAPALAHDKSAHRTLYAAAVQVARVSFGLELPPLAESAERWRAYAPAQRVAFFDRYLECSSAGGDGDARDPGLWQQAMLLACLETHPDEGATGAICGLLTLVKERAGRSRASPIDFHRLGDGLQLLFDRLFKRFGALEPDPARRVLAHLDALGTAGLELAAEQELDRLRSALAAAYRRSLFAALGQTAGPGLPAIAEPAAELLRRLAQGRRTNAMADFGVELGQAILARMAETGLAHRAAALAVLEPLEQLLAAAGGLLALGARPAPDWIEQRPGPRTSASERTARELAATLKTLILAWADAPDPQPWLERTRDSLERHPIRLALARTLGYPRCVYLGRLTDWTPEGYDYRLVVRRARPAPTRDAVSLAEGRALALGALGLWRELYRTGSPAQRGQIRALLDRDGPDADDALHGLEQIGADASPGLQRALGADVLFMAGVLSGSAGAERSPPEVRAALLDSDPEVRVLDRGFALFLARGILCARRTGLGLGHAFLARLERPYDQTLSLLGPVADWSALDDEPLRVRLDRLLFGLSLIEVRDPDALGWPRGGRRPIERRDLRAFALPDDPALQSRLRRFFRADPRYAQALEQARQLARAQRLEGWPLG